MAELDFFNGPIGEAYSRAKSFQAVRLSKIELRIKFNGHIGEAYSRASDIQLVRLSKIEQNIFFNGPIVADALGRSPFKPYVYRRSS